MPQICLIFNRRESGHDMDLVGAWLQSRPAMELLRSLPEDERSRAYAVYFGELGHLGPLAGRYFHNEPHRRVRNVKTDVGNECRFTGGFFMMGHDHPAPNENGGRPFVDFDYAMVNQDGITVCRRKPRRARAKLPTTPVQKTEFEQSTSPGDTSPGAKDRTETWLVQRHHELSERADDIPKSGFLRVSELADAKTVQRTTETKSPTFQADTLPVGVRIGYRQGHRALETIAKLGGLLVPSRRTA